jgi:hypothetical protein
MVFPVLLFPILIHQVRMMKHRHSLDAHCSFWCERLGATTFLDFVHDMRCSSNHAIEGTSSDGAGIRSVYTATALCRVWCE